MHLHTRRRWKMKLAGQGVFLAHLRPYSCGREMPLSGLGHQRQDSCLRLHHSFVVNHYHTNCCLSHGSTQSAAVAIRQTVAEVIRILPSASPGIWQAEATAAGYWQPGSVYCQYPPVCLPRCCFKVGVASGVTGLSGFSSRAALSDNQANHVLVCEQVPMSREQLTL